MTGTRDCHTVDLDVFHLGEDGVLPDSNCGRSQPRTTEKGRGSESRPGTRDSCGIFSRPRLGRDVKV